MTFPYERIVCLTEETVETLYLLGEQERIVGVSGYAVRPPEVRREKPRVSSFISANVPKILDLSPDLVLTFSDLQADIVSCLIKEGIEVHSFNQRSIREILEMILCLGSIVDKKEKAENLVKTLRQRLRDTKEKYQGLQRPLVYFEEWDDPMISGIEWVSELIEVAGGTDIFKKLKKYKGASNRIVKSQEIIAAKPDIILASWCGKKVQIDKIAKREGWAEIPAVAKKQIHEIKSPLILQPGPAALTDGLDAIVNCIQNN